VIPYNAPLEEIRFVLNELADIDRVNEIPDAAGFMEEGLRDAVLSAAGRFAEDILAPLNQIGDSQGLQWSSGEVKTPAEFGVAYRQFVDAEWNRLVLPAECGGQGVPILLSAAVRETFVAANKAFCMCSELTAIGVEALLHAASDSLKDLYIPRLVNGEWSATMNLTEPQAGSDVGALRTRALPQENGTYRIFGQKIFITFGEHDLTENIVHLVLARTPNAPEGSRGVSLFLVPKFLPETNERNDVVCSGIEHKLGNHGSPTCTLVYGDGGEGAVGWLVGEENKGLQHMFVMINGARFNVGLEGVALSERAYQQALGYARERIQGKAVGAGKESVAIIRHPDVRRMLMFMRSQTEAMRAVGLHLAAAQDLSTKHPDEVLRRERQAFVDLMIPVFKGWTSEMAIDVTRTSILVHGGLGYVTESGASQPLRDVLVCSIYEGATGIQAHDLVARKIMQDGGQTLNAWLNEVRATAAHILETGREPEYLQIGHELRKSVQHVHAAIVWVIENYPSSYTDVLAVSVPLLKLVGTVAGGWQMAKAAVAADALLELGQGNNSFYQSKLNSARFYIQHILPQTAGLSHTVLNGSSMVNSLNDDVFNH
jgi:3-(methylthio)propanoyl-CoA dehydrogenase